MAAPANPRKRVVRHRKLTRRRGSVGFLSGAGRSVLPFKLLARDGNGGAVRFRALVFLVDPAHEFAAAEYDDDFAPTLARLVRSLRRNDLLQGLDSFGKGFQNWQGDAQHPRIGSPLLK
jgi:hypothetical protein